MRLLLAVALAIPLGLDLYMPVPEDNPLTTDKIELGRRLFNDRRLSRDGSIACVTCHDARPRVFATAAPLAVGVFGRVGRRNAPALINRGYGRAFFWDARSRRSKIRCSSRSRIRTRWICTLDEASSRVGDVRRRSSQALASYVRSILSGDAPFDRFVTGDRSALTEEQQRGLQIFRGKGNCTACHVGPTFSDEKLHNTGVAWPRPAPRWRLHDPGARPRRFQDPDAPRSRSHRAVHARRQPGALEDVVDFYDRGGRPNPQLDAELRPLHLSDAEKTALVAFLHSLSGTIIDGSGAR